MIKHIGNVIVKETGSAANANVANAVLAQAGLGIVASSQ